MGVKVHPTLDRVLLRRISPQESKSGSGLIYLPDTGDEKAAFEAQVLACGPGMMVQGAGFQAVPLKGGERVLVHRGGLTEVRLGGETYLVGRYDNIMLVFVPESVEKAGAIGEYMGLGSDALMPQAAPPFTLENAVGEEVAGE